MTVLHVGKTRGTLAGLFCILVLGGCEQEFARLGPLTPPPEPPQEQRAASLFVSETDVPRPDLFESTAPGLWDGRPSLGGIWLAHPDSVQPERVLIRRRDTGASVKGALFRRDTLTGGPPFQVSSDAAAALEMEAGDEVMLEVVALRREVRTEPQIASEADAIEEESADLANEIEAAPPAPVVSEATQPPAQDADLAQEPAEDPAIAVAAATPAAEPAAEAPAPSAAEAESTGAPDEADIPFQTASVAALPEPAVFLAPPPEAVTGEPVPTARPERGADAPVTDVQTASATPDPAPAQVSGDAETVADAPPVPRREIEAPLPDVAAVFAAAPPAQSAPEPSADETSNAGPAQANAPARPYVQVGTFAVRENVDSLAQDLQRSGYTVILRETLGGSRVLTRVLVGPAETRQSRDKTLSEIRALGFSDALPVRG